MKHLFFYIVCFLAFFNRGAGAIEPPPLPDDFEGKLTREYIANYLEDDTYETTMLQNLNIYYEIGSYLYQKYPWEEITQKDFAEKIRVFFPYDSEEQLRKKHDYLVKTAALYQYGRDLYVKFANKYLVPHVYRKVHDASEFDHPREVPYIPTPDDEYTKVYNFKKFLTYSKNADELNAISEFERNREDNDDILTQIDRIVEKVDWKKVWLYGTKYKNPLFSDLGIGKSQFGDGVNVRLLARSTYTEGKEELDYGVQIATHPRYFVLANNLSAEYLKPQIDFAGSQNVANAEVLYPMPQKTNVLPQAYKYLGNFIIPLKITPQDRHEAVDLQTSVSLTVCDYALNCQPQNFTMHLHSDVFGPDKFDNGFDTLFFNSMRRVPSAQQTYLTPTRFEVVATNDGRQLFLEMKTSKKIKNFEAFIEDAKGYTQFAAPRYIVGDDTVQAYFRPLNENQDIDLDKTDYIISAVLNNRVFYRDKLTPDAASAVRPQSMPSAYKIVWQALICGVMLNFVPCLVPFMLIMLLVLIRLSKKKPQVLRQAAVAMLKGCCGGVLLASLLFSAQKYTGRDIVWGMQFSHTTVVICLLFGLSILPKLLPNLLTFITDRVAMERRMIFPVCGGIIGIMFIFTFAPYLAQLMNMTLTLPIFNTLLILLPLTAGFMAVPVAAYYLLIRPQARFYAGNNQKEILKFIRYALNISLLFIWLHCAFMGGVAYALLIALILVVWMFFCEIYQKFLDYIGGVLDERITARQIARIRNGSMVFMGILLGLFLCGSICLINHAKAGRTLNATSPAEAEQAVAARQDKPLLVIIEAEWCLKCRINRVWTLNPLVLKQWQDRYGMQIVRVSQTPYVIKYMHQYEQYDLPFYVLYTSQYPQGLVVNSEVEIENMELLLN